MLHRMDRCGKTPFCIKAGGHKGAGTVCSVFQPQAICDTMVPVSAPAPTLSHPLQAERMLWWTSGANSFIF